MENSCRKKYKPSPKKWILASRYPEFRRNSALIPANAGLFHYAGNNPVRYIDPDGRETYSSDITKEQYDNSAFLKRDKSWADVQKFFEENPDGVLHRPEDQFSFMKLESKDDIVDPNACNADLIRLVAGGKINSKYLNIGKFLLKFIPRKTPKKIPSGRWRIKRKDGTTAEIHNGHTHYDKATRKDEAPHTHEIKLRDPRDPKYKTEPLYKEKDAHKTTEDEIKLYWEQYKK